MEILNKYPIKSNDTASRILEDEAVIVLPLESIVYTFDTVGTRIWELITGSKKISGIVKEIQNEYEVEHEEAELDIIEFINELVSKKILVLSEVLDEKQQNENIRNM